MNGLLEDHASTDRYSQWAPTLPTLSERIILIVRQQIIPGELYLMSEKKRIGDKTLVKRDTKENKENFRFSSM